MTFDQRVYEMHLARFREDLHPRNPFTGEWIDKPDWLEPQPMTIQGHHGITGVKSRASGTLRTYTSGSGR